MRVSERERPSQAFIQKMPLKGEDIIEESMEEERNEWGVIIYWTPQELTDNKTLTKHPKPCK